MTTEGLSAGGREWVARLPAELDGQRAILSRLLDHCAADPRVRWLVIGCSLGRAAADRLSDLDLGAGVAAADFDAARAGLRRAVDAIGDLVESFEHQYPGVTGPHRRIFAQYADRRTWRAWPRANRDPKWERQPGPEAGKALTDAA